MALKEGPVHCATWAPDGSAFAVVAGFMPAQTIIFDAKCAPHHPLCCPASSPGYSPAPCGCEYTGMFVHFCCWNHEMER